MKKIRCPRCGVINLEKFVTFPHCAGCGASLPVKAEPNVSLLRRPISPLVLSALAGAAALGMIAAGVLSGGLHMTEVLTGVTSNHDAPNLVVYTQLSRPTREGGLLTCFFTVDTLDGDDNDESELTNVKFRLPGKFFGNFTFVAISPQPDALQMSGSGRYIYYRSLPRLARVKLTLRATHAGPWKMFLMVSADSYLSTAYHTVVMVRPAPHSGPALGGRGVRPRKHAVQSSRKGRLRNAIR